MNIEFEVVKGTEPRNLAGRGDLEKRTCKGYTLFVDGGALDRAFNTAHTFIEAYRLARMFDKELYKLLRNGVREGAVKVA